MRSANTEWHNAFMRRRVNPLRSGELLPGTPETQFVEFEDALLFTRRGVTRPVAFFDVSGENLVRSDTTLRFLAGVDALMFVVDPVLAVRLPQWKPELIPDPWDAIEDFRAAYDELHLSTRRESPRVLA